MSRRSGDPASHRAFVSLARPSSGSLAFMSGHDGTFKPEWLGDVDPGAAFVPTADTFTAPADGWYSFGNGQPVFFGVGRPASAVDAHAIVIPAWVETT